MTELRMSVFLTDIGHQINGILLTQEKPTNCGTKVADVRIQGQFWCTCNFCLHNVVKS